MTNYLYGICSVYKSALEVQKTEIIKETPKTIKVKKGISPYGYRKSIPKSFPDLAKTKQEAVNVFISNHLSKIGMLELKVNAMKAEIAEAEKLL